MKTITQEEANRLVRSATLLALGITGFLMLFKMVSWYLTGSVTLLGALLDSCLDLIMSVVTFLGVRYAMMPADKEHRFGHGKAEALTALLQVLLLFAAAALIFAKAIQHLQEGTVLHHTGLGIITAVVSILLTGVLVLYQNFVVRRTESFAVSVDSVHYKGDFLLNSFVLVAFLLADTIPMADPLFGAAIGGYLAWNGWYALTRAISQIMDEELPDAARNRIKDIVLAHPEVHSLHDLRTRRAGRNLFIQFHIELDPRILLIEAHRIADEVEDNVRKTFPHCEIIIHQDPLGAESISPLERS